MTISTIIDNNLSYTGNGSTTDFSVTFPIFKKDDGVTHYLEVIKYTIADGTTETLVENTGYTVTQSAGDPSTGTVTISPAISSAYRIYILSTLEPKQALDLVNGTAISVPDIEKALDRLTMIDQKQQEEIDRSLKFAKTVIDGNPIFPTFDGSVEGDIPTVNSTTDGYVYKSVDELVSVAAFDISALTAEATVDTAADYAAMYDTSAGAMRKVLIEDLAPPATDTTVHGNVQQVQKVTLTSSFSQTCSVAGEFQDITGLTVSITPSRANSKLLIGGWVSCTGTSAGIRVVAGGKILAKPVTNYSSGETMTRFTQTAGSAGVQTYPFFAVTDAGTTSAMDVKVQKGMGNATNVTYFNRSVTDTDSSSFNRVTCHLWVMEILQNTSPAVTSKAAEIFTLENNIYNSQATAAWAMENRLLKGALGVYPTAATSYNLFLGQINNSVAVTGVHHNIYKNGSPLFNATTPSNRASVITRCENGTNGALSILGIEALSSTAPCFYQVFTGHSGTIYYGFTAASPTLATGGEGQSYLHCVNFNTSGDSNWEAITTTTLTTTASNSTTSGSRYSTGLTATVTPASASEQLLILVNVSFNKSAVAGAGCGISIDRDGTPIVGTSASSRMASTACIAIPASAGDMETCTLAYLVSAGSTSSTTFTVTLDNSDSNTQTIYVNRSGTDTDSTDFARGISQISVVRILPNA